MLTVYLERKLHNYQEIKFYLYYFQCLNFNTLISGADVLNSHCKHSKNISIVQASISSFSLGDHLKISPSQVKSIRLEINQKHQFQRNLHHITVQIQGRNTPNFVVELWEEEHFDHTSYQLASVPEMKVRMSHHRLFLRVDQRPPNRSCDSGKHNVSFHQLPHDLPEAGGSQGGTHEINVEPEEVGGYKAYGQGIKPKPQLRR